MEKTATTSVPVHAPLAARWSPVGFAPRPVADADLTALFEAARWAASGYNEQPWRFLAARRQDADAFAAVLDCLVEANRTWARNASALVLALASTRFRRNGQPNAKALLDLGLALGNLSIEATARGLHVHPMGGILPDLARERFGVPDGVDVVVGLAMGVLAADADKSEADRVRDAAPRERLPLAELVFAGAYGATPAWLEGEA